MTQGPTGTVTFLFTDIEGSTALWDRHPEAMRPALARHDVLLRAAIDDHGGVVFSTGGDGVAAAFPRAIDAVRAAAAAQRVLAAEPWPDLAPLRVRMGILTGEAEERGGDYLGPAVSRAARLAALASGEEVLVALSTAEIVRAALPEGFDLTDWGDHELRSFSRPERVYALSWPGAVVTERRTVRHDVPGNLPRADEALVGRATELESVSAALAEAQLVTLTGVGGVGKTTLALAAARRRAPAFTDGAWVFELAAVFDGNDLASAMAETMGLRPMSGVTQRQRLIEALAMQHTLLVLDNCEHLLDAVAAIVTDVLRSCPKVQVLATSREAISVGGEHTVAVRPLAIADAAELFVRRARTHEGGFTLAPADTELITSLCTRLDGVPLAIELAAARVRSMPLADLVERIGDRFRLLRGQRRAVERHQTLRATVAWSYDLLEEREQLVFDRLSVFAGGFTLAAAEAVCRGTELEPWEVAESVAALADKSMVIADPSGRYLLLETLRQFGEERLQQHDAPDRYRTTHARYFASFAHDARLGLLGTEEGRWWWRLQAEWANVRTAFAWAVECGDLDGAIEIVTPLLWAAIWHDTAEPLLWIDTVAQLPRVEHHERYADVLAGCAYAAWERGENELAMVLGREALDAERPGSVALDHLAEVSILSGAYFSGAIDEAQRWFDHFAARAGDSPPAVRLTWAASNSILAAGRGDLDRAVAIGRELVRMAASTGNPTAITWNTCVLANALTNLGDRDAIELATAVVDLASDVGAVKALWHARRQLATWLLRDEQHSAAAGELLHTLRSMRRQGALMFANQTAVWALALLADAGHTVDAMRLAGAMTDSPAAGSPDARSRLLEARTRAGAHLSPDLIEALLAEGAAMSVEQAIARAEQLLAALAGVVA